MTFPRQLTRRTFAMQVTPTTGLLLPCAKNASGSHEILDPYNLPKWLLVALGERDNRNVPRLEQHSDASFRPQGHHELRLDALLSQLQIIAAADQG